jgi:hypothetical protein
LAPDASRQSTDSSCSVNYADTRDSTVPPLPGPGPAPWAGKTRTRLPPDTPLPRFAGKPPSSTLQPQSRWSSGPGGSASKAGAASRGNSIWGGGRAAWQAGATVGRPRWLRIRVVATFDVTTATIDMRPGHRPHARTSSRNTRHISDAHEICRAAWGPRPRAELVRDQATPPSPWGLIVISLRTRGQARRSSRIR